MRMRGILLAVAMLASAAAGAVAQTYPARPVTIVLPYAAGGNTDAIARTLANRLEQRLGQPFVIEQRLGAASVIGATYVARAAPDGYTILIGTSTTMAINVSVYKNLPYDPTRDLVPIALVAGVPFILVINPALPVKSLAELAAYAKSRPDGMTSRTAPAAPPDILNRLNAEMRAIVAEPAVQKEFSGRGLIPLTSGTPAELQTYVKSEIARWGDVVKRAGVAATQ
jgi:tripartite-type tricarboxylate transporter receptor subunit TctC